MAAGPHVLALPFPAQGHVIPLMQLSHRLVEHGVEVTFVNTEAIHELVLDAMPPAGDGTGRPSLDGIHLVGIPDGLADGDDRKDIGKLVAALSQHLPGCLEKLVRRVEASGATKISWLIADEGMGWCAFEVAKKLGIRITCFWAGSVAFLDITLRIPQLIKDGVIDEKGAISLMGFIRDIPPLKGDNYVEWRKKIDMAFGFAEIDWVIETERPTQPEAPVRATEEADAAWQTRERDFASIQMSYDLNRVNWDKANKKCKLVIQNTMEPHIAESIPVSESAKEYLEVIKRQFTGSTKTYATQLIKELISQKYTGGTNIREHIHRMSHLASKIRKFKDLTITDTFLVHLVFSSLPKEFENFVVNYNMHPETWDLEKTIAMCAQEEERIKASNGGSINSLRDNKKKNYNASYSQNKAKSAVQHQNKPNNQYEQAYHAAQASAESVCGGQRSMPPLQGVWTLQD